MNALTSPSYRRRWRTRTDSCTRFLARLCLLATVVPVLISCAGPPASPNPPANSKQQPTPVKAESHARPVTLPPEAALRERVLRADSSDKAAEAYQAYFLRLGRTGLKDRMKDEDTGIALQAAWETHLKPAKRQVEDKTRSEDVYDPAELVRFVAFLKARTKAPIPTWWADALVNVDLFPGAHHAFIGPHGGAPAGPEKRKDAVRDAQEPKVEEKGDNLVYSAGGRTVEFPKTTFHGVLAGSFMGVLGEKSSVLACYTEISGFPYQVAGFGGKGGKPAWKADVWAAGRDFLGGKGYHHVEMTDKDGVAYLFGMESHGAYLEAFEAATGRVRFRFCTCYWFHFSEKWGLK